MKNIFTLIFLFVCINTLVAQEGETPKKDTAAVKHWTSKTMFGLNGSQTAFVNWAAGGSNNVSVLGFIDGTVKYEN